MSCRKALVKPVNRRTLLLNSEYGVKQLLGKLISIGRSAPILFEQCCKWRLTRLFANYFRVSGLRGGSPRFAGHLSHLH